MNLLKERAGLKRWSAVLNFESRVDDLVHTQLAFIRLLYRHWEEPDNDGHRWSYDETERAVNMRAEGKSVDEIAYALGRSSLSVSNRISQAVGIRQMEVKIKGLINGDLEGEHAAGVFEGTLRRSQ